MARLLILDDPNQTRAGRRPRGCVVSVLADGQSPGTMAGAQFLVLDCPDLDVPTAQATYLASGVPQAAIDAEKAEQDRYRADVAKALDARAAELAAGKITQAEILAAVTPLDPTKRVDPAAYPWRKVRIALATLEGQTAGLKARRAFLAATLSGAKTLDAEQRLVRDARRTALRQSVRTAMEAFARTATEAGVTLDLATRDRVREAVHMAVEAMEDSVREQRLAARAVTPLTVTAAQLAAATVDVV